MNDFLNDIVGSIQEEINGHSFETAQEACGKSMFKVQAASIYLQDAINLPIQKRILSVLWFKGEICILFADTGLGKSILAVQIGDAITTGESIKGLPSELIPEAVLYLDFELSERQFLNRYSIEGANPYEFSPKFFRGEIDPEKADYREAGFQDVEAYISHSLEQSIIESGAKVIIVDNLTYLKDETEKAKDALPLMKHLKSLKKKYDLSMLVLAHTPKCDLWKPLTRNDLSGSKMLINFCDSAFAIGESAKDSSIRYLKQIKCRNTDTVYGSDNVVIFQIVKPHNFLRFEFIGYDAESNHLKQLSENEKAGRDEVIMEYHKKGKSTREIASMLRIGHMTVHRAIKAMEEAQKASNECIKL